MLKERKGGKEGSPGAKGCFFDGVGDGDVFVFGSKVVGNDGVEVANGEDEIGDTLFDPVIEEMFKKWAPGYGRHRFRAIGADRAETGAEPAS